MEDGRRVWAVGGRVAHGLSPPPPPSLWRAARRCLYRMENGGEAIAWRPMVLTGIGLTGSTSARLDATDKTGSGRASYSVGRASPVTSGTSPKLTRTSTDCGSPARPAVALAKADVLRRLDGNMRRRPCLGCKAVNSKKLLRYHSENRWHMPCYWLPFTSKRKPTLFVSRPAAGATVLKGLATACRGSCTGRGCAPRRSVSQVILSSES